MPPLIASVGPPRGPSGWLAGALAAAAVVIGGCGQDDSATRKASLEGQIRQQLPGEAERVLGTQVTVSEVGCTAVTDAKFDCVAQVRSLDFNGRPIEESLPIDGSCDDEGCVWSVKRF